MTTETLLALSTPSLLIVEERKNKRLVIGVPHHAPAGTPNLPCPEHTDADENAGYLGRYIAERLDCCSIIACNYRIDVNKFFRSDYAMQIAKWNPQVLIEIHGHAGKSARHNVEISSGSSENNRYSERLATKLEDEFRPIEELKELTICGKYSGLYFKATDSVTISDGRWVAYHIELPPALRKPSQTSSGKPPRSGYKFCEALIKAVSDLHCL
jgi:hypothetical protein